MKISNRRIWSTSEDNTALLTLDTKITVNVYEVSPKLLGQLMRAGLMVLRTISTNEEHPLFAEANKALLEWNLFLPPSWRPEPIPPPMEAEALPGATTHGQTLTQGTAVQERPA